MTPELPDELLAYSALLQNASDAELDRVLLQQVADYPNTTLELAKVFAEGDARTWHAEFPLGDSVNNEAAYVDLPLDEESFLRLVLGTISAEPAVLRLNVIPRADGSDLSLSVVLPAAARSGITIHCEYDLEGDDVTLTREADDHELVARSQTSQFLTGADAVRLRLVVEGDAVA